MNLYLIHCKVLPNTVPVKIIKKILHHYFATQIHRMNSIGRLTDQLLYLGYNWLGLGLTNRRNLSLVKEYPKSGPTGSVNFYKM